MASHNIEHQAQALPSAEHLDTQPAPTPAPQDSMTANTPLPDARFINGQFLVAPSLD